MISPSTPFVIAVVSAKGGTGRTTLAAALAVVLAEQGWPVRLVECDPQRTLAAHVGVPVDNAGWLSAWLAGQPFQPLPFAVTGQCFPFGALSEANELSVLSQPDRLAAAWDALLVDLSSDERPIVLVDTPAGHQTLTQQVLHRADAVLCVWLCDAASREAYLTHPQPLPAGVPTAHVINQINATRAVRKTVWREWQQVLGKQLLPIPVHQDEAVPEALQARKTVTQHAQHSQAAHDIRGIASWLVERWLHAERVA